MKLQKMRLKRGLSQSQLARRVGMKVQILQHYESGFRKLENAKLDTIVTLARGLGCSITEIIDDEELIAKCEGVRL